MTARRPSLRLEVLAPLAARLACDRRGVSAVEFAMLAPVFGLVLAGTLDLGSSAFVQFGLNASVSAGAQYAIANATTVSSSTATSLADTISRLAAGAQGTTNVTGVAAINNGVTSTTLAASTSRTGSAATSDSCYCPTGSAPSIVWGSPATCGAACAGGGSAGKFVLVSASRPFRSVFGSYGFSPSGTLTTHALVQVQ